MLNKKEGPQGYFRKKLGTFLGVGNGNTLQDSCLENPMTEKPSRVQSTGLQQSDNRLNHQETFLLQRNYKVS